MKTKEDSQVDLDASSHIPRAPPALTVTNTVGTGGVALHAAKAGPPPKARAPDHTGLSRRGSPPR